METLKDVIFKYEARFKELRQENKELTNKLSGEKYSYPLTSEHLAHVTGKMNVLTDILSDLKKIKK